MLEVKNISKTYGMTKVVLDNINFNLKAGSICGLIGHNGAGKTTLLKIIMQILTQSNGHIYIDGELFDKNNLNIKRKIIYLPDKPLMLLELTGREYLEFIISMYKVNETFSREMIEDFADNFNLKEMLDYKLQDYSHGMRKLIMIIGAFISRAKILILDEPLTGLDPDAVYKVKNMLKEYSKKGYVILFSTHLLDVAKDICNKFIFMKNGKLKLVGDLEYVKLKYDENKSLEEIFMEIMKDE
ncbi:MAG: ABC transporter ATP-binding protein [Sarcina sp.]